MKKRIISFILVISLFLSMVPASVLAAWGAEKHSESYSETVIEALEEVTGSRESAIEVLDTLYSAGLVDETGVYLDNPMFNVDGENMTCDDMMALGETHDREDTVLIEGAETTWGEVMDYVNLAKQIAILTELRDSEVKVTEEHLVTLTSLLSQLEENGLTLDMGSSSIVKTVESVDTGLPEDAVDAGTLDIVEDGGRSYVVGAKSGDAAGYDEDYRFEVDNGIMQYWYADKKYAGSGIDHSARISVKVTKGGNEITEKTTVSENDILTVTATLDQAQPKAVSLQYRTVAGSWQSASADGEGVLTWAAGEDGEKSFTVSVGKQEQELLEEDEKDLFIGTHSFLIQLYRVENALLADDASTWEQTVRVYRKDELEQLRFEVLYEDVLYQKNSNYAGMIYSSMWDDNKVKTYVDSITLPKMDSHRKYGYSFKLIYEYVTPNWPSLLVSDYKGTARNDIDFFEKLYTWAKTSSNTPYIEIGMKNPGIGLDQSHKVDVDKNLFFNGIKETKDGTVGFGGTADGSVLSDAEIYLTVTQKVPVFYQGASNAHAILTYFENTDIYSIPIGFSMVLPEKQKKDADGNPLYYNSDNEETTEVTDRKVMVADPGDVIFNYYDAETRVKAEKIIIPSGKFYVGQTVPVTVYYDYPLQSEACQGMYLKINGTKVYPTEKNTVGKVFTFCYPVKELDSGTLQITEIGFETDKQKGYNFDNAAQNYMTLRAQTMSSIEGHSNADCSLQTPEKAESFSSFEIGMTDTTPGKQTVICELPIKATYEKGNYPYIAWIAGNTESLPKTITLTDGNGKEQTVQFYVRGMYASLDGGETRYPLFVKTKPGNITLTQPDGTVYQASEFPVSLLCNIAVPVSATSGLRKDSLEIFMDPEIDSTTDYVAVSPRTTDIGGNVCYIADGHSVSAPVLIGSKVDLWVKGASFLSDHYTYYTYQLQDGSEEEYGWTEYTDGQDVTIEESEEWLSLMDTNHDGFVTEDDDTVNINVPVSAYSDEMQSLTRNVYECYVQGEDSNLQLSYKLVPRPNNQEEAEGNQYAKEYITEFTFADGEWLRWESSDESIATIDAGGNITFTGNGGDVYFMLNVRNGDSEEYQYYLYSDVIRAKAGKVPFLSISDKNREKLALQGEDCRISFSSNLTERNQAVFDEDYKTTFTVKLYKASDVTVENKVCTPKEGAEALYTATTKSPTTEVTSYDVGYGSKQQTISESKEVPVNHVVIDGDYLTDPSVRYVAIISAKAFYSTEENKEPQTLSTYANITCKAAAAKVELGKKLSDESITELDSYFVLDNAIPDVSYRVKNFDEDNGELYYTVQKAGSSGEPEKVTLQDSKGTLGKETFTVDEGELKTVYTVSVYARNSEDDPWSVESLTLNIYKAGALNIVVTAVKSMEVGGVTGGKTEDTVAKEGETYTMERTTMVEELLNGNERSITIDGTKVTMELLRNDISLQNVISINYGDYVWGMLSDQIKWETVDADGSSNEDGSAKDSKYAVLNYYQGGYYSDVDSYSYTSYMPATNFLLTGLEEGKTTVTATHARTGDSDSIEVEVERLDDEFYIFQFKPQVVCDVTYTNGEGDTFTVQSNAKGQLAIYEPSGIDSDVKVISNDEQKDHVKDYVGTIEKEDLLSGEENIAAEQLYPCNNLTLRPISTVDLYIVTPDGKPWKNGKVTLRGGVYRNNVYCSEAFFGTNDNGYQVTQSGREDFTATTDNNGKIRIKMDSSQFLTRDGEYQVQSGEKITYIFELRFGNNTMYYPDLIQIETNTAEDATANGAEKRIDLKAVTEAAGVKTPVLARQYFQLCYLDSADEMQKAGFADDITAETGYVGPSIDAPYTILNSYILYWGDTTEADEEHETNNQPGYAILPDGVKTGASISVKGYKDSKFVDVGDANQKTSQVQTEPATSLTTVDSTGDASIFVYPFSSMAVGHNTYTMSKSAFGYDEASGKYKVLDLLTAMAMQMDIRREDEVVRNCTMPFQVINFCDVKSPSQNGLAGDLLKSVRSMVGEESDFGEMPSFSNPILSTVFELLNTIGLVGTAGDMKGRIYPTNDPGRYMVLIAPEIEGEDIELDYSAKVSNIMDVIDKRDKLKAESESANTVKNSLLSGYSAGTDQQTFSLGYRGYVIYEAEYGKNGWTLHPVGGTLTCSLPDITIYTWEFPFFVGPVPCFVSIGVGFSLSSTSSMAEYQDCINSMLENAIRIFVKIGGGIGGEIPGIGNGLFVLKLGIYVKIGFNSNIVQLLTHSMDTVDGRWSAYQQMQTQYLQRTGNSFSSYYNRNKDKVMEEINSKDYAVSNAEESMYGSYYNLNLELTVEFTIGISILTYSHVFLRFGVSTPDMQTDAYKKIAFYWDYIQSVGLTEEAGNTVTLNVNNDGIVDFSVSQAKIDDRDYLSAFERSWENDAEEYTADAIPLTMAAYNDEYAPLTAVNEEDDNYAKVLQFNAYPKANPIYTEDGKLMLYLSDTNIGSEAVSAVAWADRTGSKTVDMGTMEKYHQYLKKNVSVFSENGSSYLCITDNDYEIEIVNYDAANNSIQFKFKGYKVDNKAIIPLEEEEENSYIYTAKNMVTGAHTNMYVKVEEEGDGLKDAATHNATGLTAAGTDGSYFAAWIRQTEALDKEMGSAATNDDLALTLTSGEVVVAAYSKEQGEDAAWTLTQLTKDDVADMNPRIATNSDGKAIAVWQRGIATAEDPTDFNVSNAIVYSIFNGESWSEIRTAYNATSGSIDDIRVSMTDSGEALIAFALTDKDAGIPGEIYYTVINDKGENANTVRVTTDAKRDYAPCMKTVKVGGEQKYLITYLYDEEYVDRNSSDGTSTRTNIGILVVDRYGSRDINFVESIPVAEGLGINSNYILISKPNGSFENAAILWQETGTEEDAEGNTQNFNFMRVVKFYDHGNYEQGVTAPQDIARLEDGIIIDHYSGYIREDGRIEACLFVSDYNQTRSEKVATVVDEGESMDLTVDKPVSNILTAYASIEDKAFTVSEPQYTALEAEAGFDMPVSIGVTNAGTENITKIEITLGENKSEFNVRLKPGEAKILTLAYPVPETNVSDITYSVVCSGENGEMTWLDEPADKTIVINRPDIGIKNVRLITESEKKRTVAVDLENNSNIPLEGGEKTAWIAFYKDSSMENAIYTGIIDSSNAALIDAGMYSYTHTFSVSELVTLVEDETTGNKEIPAEGITLYTKVWLENNDGTLVEEPADSNNTNRTTFESLLERKRGNAIIENESVVVDSILTSGNNNQVSVDVTLENISLGDWKTKTLANLCVTALDKDGEELGTGETYQTQSDFFGIQAESKEKKTVNITLKDGKTADDIADWNIGLYSAESKVFYTWDNVSKNDSSNEQVISSFLYDKDALIKIDGYKYAKTVSGYNQTVSQPSDATQGSMDFRGWYQVLGYHDTATEKSYYIGEDGFTAEMLAEINFYSDTGKIRILADQSFDFENTEVKNDVVLYALFNYTVNFNTLGADAETQPEAQSIAPGEKVTCPADPTRTNSEFLYWYDSVTGIKYDFDTPVRSCMVLNAKWKVKDSAGDSGEISITDAIKIRMMGDEGIRVVGLEEAALYLAGTDTYKDKAITVGLSVMSSEEDVSTDAEEAIYREAKRMLKAGYSSSACGVEFFDIDLTVGEDAVTEYGDNILEITIPFEKERNIKGIYRYHDDKVGTLTTEPDANGEYYGVDEDGNLHLFVKKLCTFGVAFTEPCVITLSEKNNTKTIQHMDSLTIIADVNRMPEGFHIKWSLSGSAKADFIGFGNQITVNAETSGKLNVHAEVVGERGNPVYNEDGSSSRDVYTVTVEEEYTNIIQKLVNAMKRFADSVKKLFNWK